MQPDDDDDEADGDDTAYAARTTIVDRTKWQRSARKP
jgi:hypothetical protein